MAALTSGGGEPFTFSAGEQAFYQEKGFTNEPGRCASCRRAHKATKGDGGYSGRSERTMYPATCSECGKETTVPFAPSGEKPVYCSDCFQKRREQRSYSRY